LINRRDKSILIYACEGVYVRVKELGIKKYNAIHKWIGRHFDRKGKCEKCGKECRTHWSNISGQYSRGRSDWQELCPKCHFEYDRYILKTRGWENGGGTGRRRAKNSETIPRYHGSGIKYGSLKDVEQRLLQTVWYKPNAQLDL
jgi:hypothetical protein